MVPIAALTAVVLRNRVVGAPVRPRPDPASRPRPDRGDARRVPDRPRRARADRRPRPGVLRPPGHASRRSSRRSSRSSSTAPWRSSSSGRSGCRASASRSRSRPGSRRRAAGHPATGGCRTSSCAGSVGSGVEALVGSVVAAASRPSSVLGGRRGALGDRSRAARRCSIEVVDRQRSAFGRSTRSLVARLADPGTALYRRDHGRPAPPPAPGRDAPSTRRRRWDAFVEASDPGSYLQLPAWAAVKAVNGWSAAPARRRTAGRAADRRPGPRPPAAAAAVGLRLRAARPGRRRLDARRRIGAFTEAVRDDLRGDGRPRLPPPDRPRDRGRRPARPRRRAAPRAARRRLAPGTADPAERDPDHRPAPPTRRRSGATCARSGASTSTRPGPAGVDRRRRRRRPARRVLPDLPRDRRPGRLPDPDRAGLPRRLGGVRARAAAPGCCSPRPPTASRWRRCSSSAAGRGSSSRTAG